MMCCCLIFACLTSCTNTLFTSTEVYCDIMATVMQIKQLFIIPFLLQSPILSLIFNPKTQFVSVYTITLQFKTQRHHFMLTASLHIHCPCSINISVVQ